MPSLPRFAARRVAATATSLIGASIFDNFKRVSQPVNISSELREHANPVGARVGSVRNLPVPEREREGLEISANPSDSGNADPHAPQASPARA